MKRIGKIVQVATSSSKDAEGYETENLYALTEDGVLFYWAKVQGEEKWGWRELADEVLS